MIAHADHIGFLQGDGNLLCRGMADSPGKPLMPCQLDADESAPSPGAAPVVATAAAAPPTERRASPPRSTIVELRESPPPPAPPAPSTVAREAATQGSPPRRKGSLRSLWGGRKAGGAAPEGGGAAAAAAGGNNNSAAPRRRSCELVPLLALNGHVHGPGCGHERIRHGDHLDYLVGDRLHHVVGAAALEAEQAAAGGSCGGGGCSGGACHATSSSAAAPRAPAQYPRRSSGGDSAASSSSCCAASCLGASLAPHTVVDHGRVALLRQRRPSSAAIAAAAAANARGTATPSPVFYPDSAAEGVSTAVNPARLHSAGKQRPVSAMPLLGVRGGANAAAAAAAAATATATTTTTTRVHASGICCPSETRLIHAILEPMPGVRSVEVAVVTKTVTVRHDAARTPPAALVAALNGARLGASLGAGGGGGGEGGEAAVANGSGDPSRSSASAATSKSSSSSFYAPPPAELGHPYGPRALLWRLRRCGDALAALWPGALPPPALCLSLLLVAASWLGKLPGAEPAEYLALGAVALLIPHVVLRAWAALRARMIDISVLMVVAVAGALALRDYEEAGAILALFGLAEWLEDRAFGRAREALGGVLTLQAETALLVVAAGEEGEAGGKAAAGSGDKKEGASAAPSAQGWSVRRVPADAVAVGDVVLVRPGDRVPVDGAVIAVGAAAGEGEEGQAAGSAGPLLLAEPKTTVDESMLTGEARPVAKGRGDAVLAGTVNVGTAALRVRASAPASGSTAAALAAAVDRAVAAKSRTDRALDIFARFYTPLAVLAAVLLAVVPSAMRLPPGPEHWVYLALVVLVTACPCALVLGTPVATVCAVARAAKHGVLVKGGAAMEALAGVRAVTFDKSGTLTEGRFAVVRARFYGADGAGEDDDDDDDDEGGEEEESDAERRHRRQRRASRPVSAAGARVLRAAALLEQHASHPLAAAVIGYAAARGAFAGGSAAAAAERSRRPQHRHGPACAHGDGCPLDAGARTGDAAAVVVDAVAGVEVFGGLGVRGTVAGRRVALGNLRLATQEVELWAAKEDGAAGLAADPATRSAALSAARLDLASARAEALETADRRGASACYVVVDGQPACLLLLADTVRPEAKAVLAALRALLPLPPQVLTGDGRAAADAAARQLGIPSEDVHADLLPEGKLALLRSTAARAARLGRGGCSPSAARGAATATDSAAVREAAAGGRHVAHVGDGVNDAPCLAGAGVGVAMGAGGSALAVDAADVVLFTDDLRGLPEALVLSRRLRRVVWANIIFAVVVKLAVLSLAGLGRVALWQSVLADVGSALVVVLHSLTLLGAGGFGGGGGGVRGRLRAWRLRRGQAARATKGGAGGGVFLGGSPGLIKAVARDGPTKASCCAGGACSAGNGAAEVAAVVAPAAVVASAAAAPAALEACCGGHHHDHDHGHHNHNHHHDHDHHDHHHHHHGGGGGCCGGHDYGAGAADDSEPLGPLRETPLAGDPHAHDLETGDSCMSD
jgi:Cd2+/Zn2+-exporting ATPase